MEQIQIFEKPQFGKIRMIEIDNTPYFVGKDVAEILGYSNSRKAIADHVDEEDKGVTKCYTLGGVQELTVINESGLYSLILSSKLPTAKQFKHWVTSEVLPSIRKYGAYATETTIDKIIADPTFGIKLLTELQNERSKNQQLEARNAELAPKAAYCDTILQNKGTVTITQIAKDYGMGAPKMNKLLNGFGVQYKQSGQWLLYAKYQDKGYTHSHTFDFKHTDGRPDVTMETKWTQKGRLFIYELLKKNGILPMIERSV